MTDKIWIAIISASSALIGVIVSQIFSLLQKNLDRKHEKNKLLCQKYEEMMLYFSDSFVWIQELNRSTTQAEVFSLAQSTSARKSLSLCQLYFHNLVIPANDYILAQQTYFESVIIVFDEKENLTAGGQAFAKNKAKVKIATDNLFKKKNVFETLIFKSSKNYLKA